MPNSERTKLLFADAFKKLLPSTPIEKIHVNQLCEICGLHRKSFYYHFFDKYELLNWIFYHDIIEPLMNEEHESLLDVIVKIIYQLEKEKNFYTAAFRMEKTTTFGNTFSSSFQDYFIKQLKYFIKIYLKKNFESSEIVDHQRQSDYYLDTVAGSIMGNIQQWLLERSFATADEYAELLKTTLT